MKEIMDLIEIVLKEILNCFNYFFFLLQIGHNSLTHTNLLKRDQVTIFIPFDGEHKTTESSVSLYTCSVEKCERVRSSINQKR